MSGTNVGLALFDATLSLMACNDVYRSLCGYAAEDVKRGASLRALIVKTLERQGGDPATFERVVETAIARLKPGVGVTFRYQAPSGKHVEVRRQRLESGAVVETARELEARETQ